MKITVDNVDEAFAEEVQKYMDDHGVADIYMKRERYSDNTTTGWTIVAKLVDGRQYAGGPFKEMKDAVKFLVRKLEEA